MTGGASPSGSGVGLQGKAWVGPLVAGLAVAVVVLLCSWPLPLRPGSHILGASQADFYGIAFGMDHLARHLLDGSWPPVHTTRMEFPAGAALVVTDLPELVLLAPITALFGATVAFNLLQLLHHALAAAAAYWCARTLGLRTVGCALAAVAFAFAPALVGTTFNQNPDASAWYWVPLVAGLAGGATTWRRAGLAGLCVGMAAWCTPYAGVMAAAALLLLLRGWDWRRWAAALAGAVLLGGAAALVAWWSVKDPGSAVFKPAGRIALHGAASPKSLLVPWPELHTSLDWDRTHFVHGAYLGWSLLLLGVAGTVLARRWRWLLLAGLGVLLALGPVLGDPQAGGIPNPLWALGNELGLSRLWQYHRYSALAVLALALGAGWLAQRWGRWAWAVVLMVALDLMVLSGGWRLLGSAPVFDDGTCALLEGLPDGAVYDAPSGGHELWLHASVCHGRPVASGINRPSSRYLHALFQERAGADPERRLSILRQLGFRYIVAHPTAPGGQELGALVTLAAPCELRRNELGTAVMDLQGCPLVLPAIEHLPPARVPGR